MFVHHYVLGRTQCWSIVHSLPGISIGIRAGILFCLWVRSRENTFWLYGQGRRRCVCCSYIVLVVCIFCGSIRFGVEGELICVLQGEMLDTMLQHPMHMCRGSSFVKC
ncbi:hypothetical protein QL285_044853 [Trifolium repens]|nr:hypothetical protein QL285_044853 [Trifolium repens]